MADLSQIHPGAEIIGADGVHVGVVEHIDSGRLRLTKMDTTNGRRHFIDAGLIAGIEGGVVRLSAIGAVALILEDDDGGSTENQRLDEGLEETFPASDPVSASDIS
jgi:hypothetical protein